MIYAKQTMSSIWDTMTQTIIKSVLYWLSSKTSYRKISSSLEAARWKVVMIGTAAEVPIKFVSDWKILNRNFAARGFTKSYGKTAVG